MTSYLYTWFDLFWLYDTRNPKDSKCLNPYQIQVLTNHFLQSTHDDRSQ